MREIKYRGKCKDGWHYGNVDPGMFIQTYKEYCSPIGHRGIRHAVDLDTIGQFAGIDKAGKETYEGDIVEYGPEKYRYLVEWDENECGFILRHITEKNFVLKGAMIRHAVVIGNRFDNPDFDK